MKDKHLTVTIENGELIISIGIDTLKVATEYCELPGFLSNEYEPLFLVSDPGKWAESIKYALENEEEDGTTVVHEAFDKAFFFAMEQGFEGIEEAPDASKESE